MSYATTYGWLKQDPLDRGEADGCDDAAAARARRGLPADSAIETELAVARKVNEVFLAEGIAQKALPGHRASNRAGLNGQQACMAPGVSQSGY